MNSSSQSSDSQFLAEVLTVCFAARDGDLEPRITLKPNSLELEKIGHAINALLDSADVYVRESTASIHAAHEGRYYRRVIERGMRGTFRAGATLLNGGVEQMKQQQTQLDLSDQERKQILVDLEQTLLESAAKIATAMNAISEITRSTKVLALNAKIEAARAGDAGRGFTIVAHEVEKTSERVSKVMEEINALFENFKKETQTVIHDLADRKVA